MNSVRSPYSFLTVCAFAAITVTGCSNSDAPQEPDSIDDGVYSLLQLAPYIYPDVAPESLNASAYVCISTDVLTGHEIERRALKPPECDSLEYSRLVLGVEDYERIKKRYQPSFMDQVAINMSVLLYGSKCGDPHFQMIGHYSWPLRTREIINYMGC